MYKGKLKKEGKEESEWGRGRNVCIKEGVMEGGKIETGDKGANIEESRGNRSVDVYIKRGRRKTGVRKKREWRKGRNV